MDEKLKYKIGITLLPGIGPVLAKNLIAYTGDVEAVFTEKKANLLKIPGIGEITATEIKQADVLGIAEKEVEFIEKHKITPWFYLDANYPKRLKQCNDAPVLCVTKGNADLNQAKILSFVGTRKATTEGKEICNNFIKQLTERNHDVLVVSGLAYGIDIASHKAALKNKLKTAAVLAHGLHMIYPPVHRAVAAEIVDQGILVTEFLSQSKFDPKNFLQRNRIIAGLADATIVVESGISGGSLITADLANSYNRDVFAFPGRISDKQSQGCNKLIKTNKAALIESVEDIEYILGWEYNKASGKIQQPQLFVQLTAEEQKIADILKEHGNLMIDHLASYADMPMSKISVLLLNMEFAGIVKSLPGKVYGLK